MAKKNSSVPVKHGSASTSISPYDYGEMAGQGWEGTSQEDFAIPFITLLQQLSPQLQKKDPAYIEGAEEGDLMNTVTGELMKKLIIVPVVTEHAYMEWKPRETGGGLVGAHSPDSDIVADAKANGEFGNLKHGANELIQTFYLYALALPDAEATEGEPVIIAFTSTKIKKYKKIMSRLRTYKNGRIPLFAYRLELTSCDDTNSKKQHFKNFEITPLGGSLDTCLIPPELPDGSPHPLLEAAQSLREAVRSGLARVDHESQRVAATEKGDDDESLI